MKRRAFIAALLGISTLRGILPRFGFERQISDSHYRAIRESVTAEALAIFRGNLELMRRIHPTFPESEPGIGQAITVARPQWSMSTL